MLTKLQIIFVFYNLMFYFVDKCNYFNNNIVKRKRSQLGKDKTEARCALDNIDNAKVTKSKKRKIKVVSQLAYVEQHNLNFVIIVG